MPLEHEESFYATRLEEERDAQKGKTEGIWLTAEERKQLEAIAVFFHQPKISTTIKHCVDVAAQIIEGRDPTPTVRDILFKNYRNNIKNGYETIKPDFQIS